MKKFFNFLAAAAVATALTGCAALQIPGGNVGSATGSTSGSTGSSSSSDSGSQSLLGSLLSTLIGNAVPLSEQALVGTWQYDSPEVRFDSESALAQAGGAVTANSLEKRIAEIYGKIGITKGACSFKFNADHTCVLSMGSRAISGTWSLDVESRTLNIRSNTGVLNLNAKVYYSVTSIAILFDATKLLTTIKAIGTLTGQYSAAIGATATMIDSFKGLQIGMNLTK